MAAPVRKAKARKGTAQAGIRRPRAEQKADQLAAAQAAYKEALEQQRATGEILNVISRSPTAVQPVFEAIAASAVKLLRGFSSVVAVRVGEELHLAALTSTNPAGDEVVRRSYPRPLSPTSGILGAVVCAGAPSIIPDTEAPSHTVHDPGLRARAKARGYRSAIGVPMMRGGVAIGGLTVTRKQPGEFSAREIQVLRTFADQAVIAIENARLFNETKEALEQQTATADILKVISRSPTDIQPVLDAVAESAARLCGATDVVIRKLEGESMMLVAHFGSIPVPPQFAVMPLSRTNISGRTILERKTIQVADVHDAEVRKEFPDGLVNAPAGVPYRTLLVVPLLREGVGVGVIIVRRTERRLFSTQQIALLETFAHQAVIAMENVRLFNETKQALEQQKASGEVLGAISSSISDTSPVFDKILERCEGLFQGQYMGIGLAGEDGFVHVVARRGLHPTDDISSVGPIPLTKESGSGLTIIEQRIVHFAALHEDADVPPVLRGNAAQVGLKSILFAPMFWEGRAIGTIYVGRRVAGPFTDKQIALLKTFADQAVIAIQNTRLFNETKEALERQTATAEVLRVISQSPTDVQPVFDAIVESCFHLFKVGRVTLWLRAGERVEVRARRSAAREKDKAYSDAPLDRGSGVGRCVLDARLVHIPDMLEALDEYPRARQLGLSLDYRAALFAPLARDDKAIGAISILRPQPGPFSEKEISLLKTFADQAVIAIENVRLFHEIQEKSRQLEEASRHKSQFLASMSHELRTPLNAILGFNEMILGGIYGDVPGEMTEPLKDIQTSGKHLLRLINNVLDLAKIEAGRMELALGDYSVQDTVAGVHATLRPLAAEKGLEFQAEVPADIPIAHGDAGRITQCLMNLAGNSLKFTKQGRVVIAVEQADGRLRYSVTDTGIGIPADKIGSLFTEFKQTDATIASEFGGTGLGLSITRKFIEMHGGRIWVESEPGKGSAFRFEVPLRVGA